PAINDQRFQRAPIPLPPLSEQQRIVAKLEEILPQIDKLQAVEEELAKLQDEFPQKLKNSLLQAAIQGKLTEQLPEDGDARELLAEIETEKQRLIKEGKIKKQKLLPAITQDEIPFEI
ncbi:MAG TPA: restriction endonuclease subunit S, partial [Firmicutes bacterium]|nr:restriction endonuclease subunit S [Bacillota bacterium]